MINKVPGQVDDGLPSPSDISNMSTKDACHWLKIIQDVYDFDAESNPHLVDVEYWRIFNALVKRIGDNVRNVTDLLEKSEKNQVIETCQAVFRYHNTMGGGLWKNNARYWGVLQHFASSYGFSYTNMVVETAE